MKSLIISLLAFGLLSGPVSSFAAKENVEKPAAKEKVKKGDPKKKPTAKKSAHEVGPLAFSGKVSKKETKGKDGKIYKHRNAFCLETQKFPDSPNNPSYPSSLLEPGQTYRHMCVYRFRTK